MCFIFSAKETGIRAVTRITGISKTTVTKLLVDAGQAAAWYQERTLRDLKCRRVQVHDIWGFSYARQKNVSSAKNAPADAGDVWLWVATDADTKLVSCWLVGGRDSEYASSFIEDLASRLARRIQLTSDGHKAYLEAGKGAFSADIDYAMLQKLYGAAPEGEKRYPAECIGYETKVIEGKPDPKHISTSYSERNNPNIRMNSRRMT